jgi:hypothetical protein
MPAPDVFPASADQEFMWYAVELDPERPTYNLPYRADLTGPLDPAALRRALTDVVARHEALRTTFRLRDATLWQVVREPCTVDLPVVDLSGAADAEERAADLTDVEVGRLFDLRTGPLLRATLIRLTERRYRLLLVIHHLVFDGWSTGVLFDDLARAYDARVSGGEPFLAPAKMRYGEFARWQRDQLTGQELSRLLTYWRRRLTGVPHVLTLPSDRVRANGDAPAGKLSRDAVHPVQLPATLDKAVRALARAERATLFMTMLSAYAVLLHEYTGERALLIGTPVANRPRPETATMIGLFVNMLPVRADLAGEPTYRELIGRLRETVLSGFGHQLPIEHIVADLRPERRRGRRPLFQVIFWLHEYGSGPQWFGRLGEVDAAVDELPTGAAMYSIELGVRDTAEGLRCELSYNAAEFDASTIAHLATRYLAVLERMTADPDQRVPIATPGAPADRAPAPARPVAARSSLERTIARTWRSVLGVEEVGLDDNFFNLGGHSRLMAQVRDDLAGSLGVRVTLLDLFEYPTVGALAEYLAANDARTRAAEPSDLGDRQRAGRLRLRQTRGGDE